MPLGFGDIGRIDRLISYPFVHLVMDGPDRIEIAGVSETFEEAVDQGYGHVVAQMRCGVVLDRLERRRADIGILDALREQRKTGLEGLFSRFLCSLQIAVSREKGDERHRILTGMELASGLEEGSGLRMRRCG